MSNIAATLLKICAARGDRIGFRQQGDKGYRPVTCKEFCETSLKISRLLQDKGVGSGDRVLIAAENSPEWAMTALAVLNRGATLVPVAAVATISEIEAVLVKSQPKFMFFSELIGAAGALKNSTKLPDHFSWNSESEKPLQAVAALSPDKVNDDVPDSAVAVLIYTSGTTGNPKAVPLTHQNILVNANGVPTMLRVTGKDRLVSVLPLSHMLEFTCGFVAPILIGAQVTYAKSLKGEDILRGLKDSRATLMVGVPLLYEIMARGLKAKFETLPKPVRAFFELAMEASQIFPLIGKIVFFPIHLALGGRLRFFVAGGSRLHPDIFRFFRSIGIPMVQGYGLTETSPVLALTHPSDNDPDFVGRAMPSVDIGIFNDKGEKQPVGVEGEIWAKGPNVFAGYLDSAHNEGVFQDGWFKTGDLGMMDYRQMLRITGRKKDIIVTSAGKNVYPEEIEGMILASGKFLEASALGMKDGDAERVVLVVVPDRSKFAQLPPGEFEREVERTAQGICKSLSDYKWPQRIEVFHEELPKTITRKVKKHELRKILEKNGGQPQAAKERDLGATLNLRDELEGLVARTIGGIRNMPAEKISGADILNRDLGIDSLTFVEIVGAVEKKYDAQIEGVEFANITTVADLLNAFRSALEKSGKIKRRKVRFVDFQPMENLQPYWAWPRRFFNVFMRAGLKIHYRMSAYGLENIREGGPYVFTPNHGSHFDTLAVMSSIPGKDVHYTFAVAAKDYFFNKTWKAAVARLLINAIPFDRKMRIEESMERCCDVLNRGGSLVIFPEGTRSPTGQIQDFKPGVGRLLAGREKVRAVPVYISGAYDIMPKGSKFPRGMGVHLKIYFGKPISFGELEASQDAYKTIAQKLQEEVVQLEKQHQGG